MALQLSASIYGINTAAVGTAQGLTLSFPTQGIRIEPASLTLAAGFQQFNGVTVQSCIQVLPTGLNTNERRFYSASAVSALVTAANT